MRPEFKDLFAKQAAEYARYRPVYPEGLFRHLASLAPERRMAWDCATGSGQAAVALASHFDAVVATDAQKIQLRNAAPHPKIAYREAAAERSGLEKNSIDLVTVAQAFHWFRQPEFFAEVRRVLAPRGILAVWCYQLAKITPAVDAVIDEFYTKVLDGCWEKERRLVDEGYRGERFPFEEIATPPFEMTADWTLDELRGYLGTWSAVQTCLARKGFDPVERIAADLAGAWGAAPRKTARWPLFLRVFRI